VEHRAPTAASRAFVRVRATLGTTLVVVAPLFLALASAGDSRAEDRYDLLFTARFMPSQGLAQVSIRVRQSTHLARKLEFPIDPERYFRFEGDGTIETQEGRLVWTIPTTGGELRYNVRVDHLREASEYDARLSHDWALLRGSDLFPPGVATTLKGATSNAKLRLRIPPTWKALVPFEADQDGRYPIPGEDTRYDRPSGWMLLGEKLNIRTARIHGMEVRIGGPRTHHVRARDLMALLRWTLPSLQETIGKLPESLVIVLAEDPMWRGGLSGPGSIYLHADRPLIESDGSSPLLHELIHVVMGASAGDRSDWIVEGLAEYYSLELLLRSGTVSDKDHEQTLERMGRKAAPISKLGKGEAGAAETARAVLIMQQLDQAIREKSDGARSLDDVLRGLAQHPGKLDVADFTRALQEYGGGDFTSLLPPAARR
jgi:hypothetical protein